jgi:hypothetical protein
MRLLRDRRTVELGGATSEEDVGNTAEGKA